MRPAGILLSLVLAASPAAARTSGGVVDISEDANDVDVKNANEELEELQKRIEHGDIPKVQFEFDSYKLKADSFDALHIIADIMLRNPRIKLQITAHTCTIGTAKYNQRLSELRGASVKEHLSKNGVPPPSMHVIGKGFREPVADNGTEEGREKNRRVEFKFLKRWWSAVY
ncbi:MAG: OmpA family protein [Elusimicrobia bacterium]|nr:OmpA family protein [Elusimicrobiota bacterium]